MRVMASDGVSRRFLLIFFNAEVKSLAVAIIMSMAVAVGMKSFWGNQDTTCTMITELVEGILI